MERTLAMTKGVQGNIGFCVDIYIHTYVCVLVKAVTSMLCELSL